MILNTASRNDEAQTHPYLYLPMDPKYLYPGRQQSPRMTGYDGGFSEDDQNSAWGVDALISQRMDIILSKAHMLLSEIYQRYKLKEENLYQISLDQCTCRNLIYVLGDNFMDKRRLDLERQIIGLEQEKRKENGSCFRDTLFLKKELRETVIEKLEEGQKAALLTNQTEGLLA